MSGYVVPVNPYAQACRSISGSVLLQEADGFSAPVWWRENHRREALRLHGDPATLRAAQKKAERIMRKDALDARLGVAEACCAARLRNEVDALPLGYWRENLPIQACIVDGV
jgi:hypothetical protein